MEPSSDKKLLHMNVEQQRAIAAAERALEVPLHHVTALSADDRRNLILRASTPSRSVIIKATRDKDYRPQAAEAFEAGLVKEWVATAFLSRHAPGNAPAFFGGDAEFGLIVLEDVGESLGSLVGPLLGGSAGAAERALIAYATAIGRLHADTLHCIDRHADFLQRDFPAAIRSPFGAEAWRRAGVDKVAALLGSAPPADAIEAIAQRLSDPGPWHGLAHRDGCPDNVLLSDGRAHLIDFEFAGPGHVLLDATYWRLGFPTCWCAARIPDGVIASMDRAYHNALPIGVDDGAFRQEMAMLLFVRMFASQAWLLEGALRDDSTWGISTNRPRLLWHIEAAIAGAEGVPILDGLRATAMRWRDDLGRRWPDAQPLAFYPAFR
jgi:Ser/Thr protein kinase RdoA (MazF antagonist)